MTPIEVTINQEALNEIIQWHIDALLDEFRKKCCGNKSRAWVALYIFSRFNDEITGPDGWLIRANARGQQNIIFAKPAKEWMEENRQRIDWRAKLPR